MLHLIVVGATGKSCPAEISEAIQDALFTRRPEHVHFVETREGAYALLEKRYPRAVLAYAPGVFGAAVDGAKLSPKIKTTEAQLVITVRGKDEPPRSEGFIAEGGERISHDPMSQWDGTSDPRQFLTSAIAALGVNLALAVDSEAALDVLSQVLEQPQYTEAVAL